MLIIIFMIFSEIYRPNIPVLMEPNVMKPLQMRFANVSVIFSSVVPLSRLENSIFPGLKALPDASWAIVLMIADLSIGNMMCCLSHAMSSVE